ncbi:MULTISPECIES: cell division protein ZapA [Aliagarivorans]|uniref:cell division protein ZapA n=1 Tax=Aliagarivorans TaxID=882379 RepID=UPI00041AF593|nr:MULTISPECIES: cell division protein ZapA [Aliagarivorans]
MTQAVDISLLGKSYKIACPEGEEAKLRAAAEEFGERVASLKQNTKIANLEHLAIMAGLNLAYDLRDEQDKNQHYANNMNKRIKDLQVTIERVLMEQSQGIDNDPQQ